MAESYLGAPLTRRPHIVDGDAILTSGTAFNIGDGNLMADIVVSFATPPAAAGAVTVAYSGGTMTPTMQLEYAYSAGISQLIIPLDNSPDGTKVANTVTVTAAGASLIFISKRNIMPGEAR